uniref:Uncharacterized protein n=1 Tax=viral metagenome TaxID=1070528 RepID=A0A6M3LC59_9ZZZZ
MTLIAAINTFTGNISISGIKRVYSLAELKAGVSNPDLPALIPMVRTGTYNRETYGATAGAYGDKHSVRFRLLLGSTQTKPFGEALAELAEYAYSFRVAVVTLDSQQSSISVEPASYEGDTVDWYGESFFGCDFVVEFIV